MPPLAHKEDPVDARCLPNTATRTHGPASDAGAAASHRHSLPSADWSHVLHVVRIESLDQAERHVPEQPVDAASAPLCHPWFLRAGRKLQGV